MHLHHACGYLKHLFSLIAEAKTDGLESLSPAPIDNVDVYETMEVLPEHIAVIGGLESVFLLKSTKKELKKREKDLFEYIEGKRFMLANGDSCPPEVNPDQFMIVKEAIKEYNNQRM